MSAKNNNTESVIEEDFDLFYGFIDSVFKEQEQLEVNHKKTPLATSKPENRRDPFEEFITAIPQPDDGDYHSQHITPPDRKALPGNIHPNHYGTISGIITSITLCAAFLFTVYFLTSKPTTEIATNSRLDRIEQSISAVENKMPSTETFEVPLKSMATTLEAQMKAIVIQLDQLKTTIPTPQSNNNDLEVTPQSNNNDLEVTPQLNNNNLEVTPNSLRTPWVINIASFRSTRRAQAMLEEIQSKGIAAKSSVATVHGKQWIRIRLAGFNDRNEATQAKLKLAKILPEQSLWVGVQ